MKIVLNEVTKWHHLQNTTVMFPAIYLAICFMNPTGQTVSSQREALYLPTQTQANSDSIPTDFLALGFDYLFAHLSKLYVHKTEFETSSEFASRIAMLSHRTALGTYKADSDLCANIGISASYDADHETMCAGIPFDPLPIIDAGLPCDSDLGGYTVPASEPDTTFGRSYFGTNAFGVRKRVTPVTVSRNTLYFCNPKRWGFDSSNEGGWDGTAYRIYFKMPHQQARELKDRLRAIAVFKAVYPFTCRYTSKGKATIDFPYQQTTHLRMVIGSLESFCVYDDLTGKIYAKSFPPKQIEEGPLR